MNFKNINPMERHVEKIALAVAAAGAAYMIYLASSPLSVPGPHGEMVPARDVEQQVSDAVQSLETMRRKTQAQSIKVAVPDFVGDYLKRTTDRPLPPELVSMLMPSIGPLHVLPQKVDISQGPESPIATPAVPAPTDVTAVSWVGQVMVPSAAGAPGVAPGVPGGVAPGQVAAAPLKDEHLVILSGKEDLGVMIQAMAAAPLAERLPAAFQQAVVYRVEAERRPRHGGAWGDWEKVQPDPLLPALPDVPWDKLKDEDVAPAVDSLVRQFEQIVHPEYFPQADGTSVVQQLLKPDTGTKPGTVAVPGPGTPGVGTVPPPVPVIPPGGGGSRGVVRGGGAPTPGGAMRGGGAPTPGGVMRGGGAPTPGGMRPEYGPDMRGGPGGGWPPPGAGGPVMPATLGAAPQGPTQYWVLDDQATPGREYQYRMRVVVYNPTYRWEKKLQDPGMAKEPLLKSEWVMAANTVSIRSDMYFFMTGGIGGVGAAGPAKVNAQVYKYSAGKWYRGYATAQPGQEIKAKIALGAPEPKPQPAPPGVAPAVPGMPPPAPALVPETDVDTFNTVVDVLAEGNQVVLLNREGDLVVRDAVIDRENPDKKWLDKEVDKSRPVPVVAPQPAPRPAPVPFPDRTPPGGDRTPGAPRAPGPFSGFDPRAPR